MRAMRLELPDHDVVELPVRALRISLAVGIAVDLLGAVGMRLMPGEIAGMLGVPAPIDNDFWPRYSAVFLVVVPIFYLIAALNPARYLANAAGAVAARLLGFIFYLTMFSRDDTRKAFLFLAIMNLALAATHAWLIRPAGWSRVWASLRPAQALP